MRSCALTASRSRRRSATGPSGGRVALLDARGERTIVVQGERIVPAGERRPAVGSARRDGRHLLHGRRCGVAARRARGADAGGDTPGARRVGGQRRDARRARAQRRRRGRADDDERRLVRAPDRRDARCGWGDLHVGTTAAPAHSPPLRCPARSSMPTAPATPLRPGSRSRLARAWTSTRRWRWPPAAARQPDRRRPVRGAADRGGPGPVTTMGFPSGEQIEIALGDQRAVVVEVGGGLRTYSVAGRDVLDGYGAGRDLPVRARAGLEPVAEPACRTAATSSTGERHQLPLDQPDEHNAIHGLVRWSGGPSPSARRTVWSMEHLLHPRPGYPFSLALAIEYRLSEEGLAVRTTATNVGSRACPFGTGAHPYLSAGTPTVDSAVLHVAARTVLQSNERGIPIGETAVDGTDYDFRRPRPIGADPPGPLLHRPRARRRRHRARDAAGSSWRRRVVVGGRGLPVRDALHRRPAARRRPPQPRGRAHDVPAERVPDGKGSDPPRSLGSRSPPVGYPPLRHRGVCPLGEGADRA